MQSLQGSHLELRRTAYCVIALGHTKKWLAEPMITVDELKRLLELVEAAQEGAIQLRMKHMDDAAAFESVLDPLHHAASKLTELLNPGG